MLLPHIKSRIAKLIFGGDGMPYLVALSSTMFFSAQYLLFMSYRLV